MILDRTTAPEGTEVVDDVVERLVERELVEVLAEIGRVDGAAEFDFAFVWGALPDEGLDEGRFSCAVGAHERDDIAAVGGGAEAPHEGALAHADRELLGDDHAVTAAIVRLEAEDHDATFARGRGEARKAIQAFTASFGLRGILAG